MSINPPSDLLLDVARAADPATSAAAAERLSKIGAQGGNIDVGFSEVLDGVGAMPPNMDDLTAGTRVTPRPSTPVDAKKKAYQGLEGLLLQKLVETMLPNDSEIFGEGSAGMIWRSMLAQELGTDLAKSVDLGIEPRYLRSGNGKASHRAETGEATDPPIRGIGHVTSKHV